MWCGEGDLNPHEIAPASTSSAFGAVRRVPCQPKLLISGGGPFSSGPHRTQRKVQIRSATRLRATGPELATDHRRTWYVGFAAGELFPRHIQIARGFGYSTIKPGKPDR